MAKYICPSCGAPYNGKKCRNCAYESFSEEIAHNFHVHEGEPLVCLLYTSDAADD